MISRYGRIIFLVALSAAAIACDKLPLLAPTNSTITLFAASNTVQANGSTTLTATILESSGTPVQNGTLVSFTTTVGQISPSEARTQNGKVTVMFAGSGQSGEAQIQANSGGAKLTAPLSIKVGGAAASRIQLTANPGTVSSSGGSSQVTAAVVDANGNSLASVAVSFSTTAGSLSSAVATTDANGQAMTTLTTSREAIVTATAGGATTGTTAGATGTVTVKVNVLPGLSITPPSGTITAGVAANFTVAASVPTGASSFQDATISFGDGSSQSLGALSGSVTVPHIYTTAGTYSVSVSGTDVTGATVPSVSTAVTVLARGALDVAIAANPSAPRTGEVVTFTATITESGSSTAPAVTSYVWSWDDGTGEQSGKTATHVFQSAGRKAVTLAVTTSDGRAGSGRVDVLVSQTTLNVALTASPNPAKSTDNVVLTATVTQSPSGTLTVTRYEWDFGDGSGIVTTTSGSTNHVYTSTPSGTTRTATVTPTTSEGVSATGRVEVRIQN